MIVLTAKVESKNLLPDLLDKFLIFNPAFKTKPSFLANAWLFQLKPEFLAKAWTVYPKNGLA